jgi:hypothetical protein
MLILFYSDQCDFSRKLLDFLDKYNIKKNFNLINIDKIKEIPSNISVVPTIIDTSIEAPFEGKKAFEFIINKKYFNYPTNNIDYWVKNMVPKPVIEEDKKAIERHNFNFASFDDEPTKLDQPIEQEPIKQIPIDKKSLALLKLRR